MFYKSSAIKRRESGNVLFLILIAVALFAALAFAVSNSSRVGGGDTKKEQADLIAGVIVQYTAQVESAIERLKVIHGCANEDISFDNPFIAFVNPVSPTDKRCHIFDPAGGGIQYMAAQTNWIDEDRRATLNAYTSGYGDGYFFPNAVQEVDRIGSTNMGDAGVDLTIMLLNIRKDICEALNQRLGFNPPSYVAPNMNSYMTMGFDGNFSFRNRIYGNFGDSHSGCVFDSQMGGFYNFIVPVIVR